jgi:hypothetical protein
MISNHRLLFLIHLYLNPLKPRFSIFYTVFRFSSSFRFRCCNFFF